MKLIKMFLVLLKIQLSVKESFDKDVIDNLVIEMESSMVDKRDLDDYKALAIKELEDLLGTNGSTINKENLLTAITNINNYY